MGPTPKPERMNAYLEVSGGKTAHIEPVRKTSQGRAYQIVFKNSQVLVCDGKKSKMHLYKVFNKQRNIHMAFCFELQDKEYFLAVERDSEQKVYIKLQPRDKSDIFSNRFLFKWAEDNGEYGSLCLVEEPNLYLHVHDDKVTLSSKPNLGFRVQVL
ncbi:uncharacterized protein Hap1MRO34_023397 [Clarias gariepinus]